MGGDLIISPAKGIGVIDRWCQIPTHPHPMPQGGIVGQTIDRCIISSIIELSVDSTERTSLILTLHHNAYSGSNH